MEPSIIAENEHLIVLNKPAGLIVHSDARTEESTLTDWLVEKYPSLIGVGESWTSPQGDVVPLPGIVHRLDRTTSGVMLVAKTNDAFMYLKSAFKARKVDKIYRAFVYGTMESESGKIIAEIKRSSAAPRRWYARPCELSDKRAAVTEWKLLSQVDGLSYTEASPKTGRTHQIRVHLSSIGHPVVADHLYAPDCSAILGFNRPALHAYSVSLELPNNEKVKYVAPLPQDFHRAAAIMDAALKDRNHSH